MNYCDICGKPYGEEHHIIFRSQCQAMIKAPINHIYLCPEHHRGTYGVHGREGHNLDIKLKMQMQHKLSKLFNRKNYSKKEIKELLGISNKDVDMLFKTVSCKKGKYDKSDVVRVCMGGKSYV